MFGWIKRKIAEKWIKELEANIGYEAGLGEAGLDYLANND